ncbi:uncharacterized protein LOC6726355 [Drosophila simulans]|uniref:GD15631 n=1 Tax=Drosophila simulans TaxID=7240 RepID=B4R701_DROSI|nr:uncharacterized protein LOC6726355 [Drosophila simulans]EDX18297.1 GD15631 [Drosophila simulans]KMZ10517.1 uncharacterized protein Dsimw501_GD15631 [Drosophila simulans]
MSKLSLILLSALLGCLVSGGAAGTIRVDTTGIRVVDDIHVFAAQYPGLQIQQMEKEIVPGKARAGSQTVRYNMGARIPSDELVAQTANTYEFPRAQDVSLQLTYPENGKGAIVSYVELLCTQDTQEGTAYVVAGGIGQSLISIVLEARNTKNFSYQALYYGIN